MIAAVLKLLCRAHPVLAKRKSVLLLEKTCIVQLSILWSNPIVLNPRSSSADYWECCFWERGEHVGGGQRRSGQGAQEGSGDNKASRGQISSEYRISQPLIFKT